MRQGWRRRRRRRRRGGRGWRWRWRRAPTASVAATPTALDRSPHRWVTLRAMVHHMHGGSREQVVEEWAQQQDQEERDHNANAAVRRRLWYLNDTELSGSSTYVPVSRLLGVVPHSATNV